MRDQFLDDILGDFQPGVRGDIKSGGAVSIWLRGPEKARYDRLQKLSGRAFNKKVRELLLRLMDAAEARAV